MVTSPANRTAVTEAFKKGPSVYILAYIQDSIEERMGIAAARLFERELINLTERFQAFKFKGLPICSDIEIEQLLDQKAKNTFLAPYLLSSLAFQAYRQSKADTALLLLEEAKRVDQSLIGGSGLVAYHSHLLQSDQNICRMFLGSGRSADGIEAFERMLFSLLRTFETDDARLSVTLELMGMQMVSYLVGLIQACRIEDPIQYWDLASFPPSHTRANIELWIALRDGDKRAVLERMRDPNAVHFGILKQPAIALLSPSEELNHV